MPFYVKELNSSLEKESKNMSTINIVERTQKTAAKTERKAKTISTAEAQGSNKESDTEKKEENNYYTHE